MKRLIDVDLHRLRWTQPRLFNKNYELRCGDDIVTTLTFRSALGSMATARTTDGAWTFKRVGFWRTRATVRAAATIFDLATFEHNTWSGGGSLILADGRSILVTTNLWQSKIEFQMPEGDVLFRYRTEGFMREEAELETRPALEGMAEMPWLLAFGWYLVLMMHQDSASSAAIIC